MGLSRYQEHQGAAPPGCRVDIYWYQDLSGKTLRAQRTVRLESMRFLQTKVRQIGGAPLLFRTETTMWSEDELKRAGEEDRMVQRVLAEARNRPSRPMSTPESIAAGDAAMAEGRERAAETLARRIENKELLSAVELQGALGITQAEIDDAVDGNRLFALDGPDGAPYYPAFYADADIDKPALELVAQELCDIPAASKYHFFVSRRTNLGATPLEALKGGRVEDVLHAAAGFANI